VQKPPSFNLIKNNCMHTSYSSGPSPRHLLPSLPELAPVAHLIHSPGHLMPSLLELAPLACQVLRLDTLMPSLLELAPVAHLVHSPRNFMPSLWELAPLAPQPKHCCPHQQTTNLPSLSRGFSIGTHCALMSVPSPKRKRKQRRRCQLGAR
jgi:hypothetical protein